MLDNFILSSFLSLQFITKKFWWTKLNIWFFSCPVKQLLIKYSWDQIHIHHQWLTDWLSPRLLHKKAELKKLWIGCPKSFRSSVTENRHQTIYDPSAGLGVNVIIRNMQEEVTNISHYTREMLQVGASTSLSYKIYNKIVLREG